MIDTLHRVGAPQPQFLVGLLESLTGLPQLLRRGPGQTMARLSGPGENHWIRSKKSGKGSRPMMVNWAQSLRDQCTAASVLFQFKQWANWAPDPNNTAVAIGTTVYPPMVSSRKKFSDRLLDGVEWNGVPTSAL